VSNTSAGQAGRRAKSISAFMWTRRSCCTMLRSVLFDDAINCYDYTASAMSGDGWMDEWWNDSDRGKQEHLGQKYLTQCHVFLHQPHTDWPGIEHMPPQREADDEPPEPWHGPDINVKSKQFNNSSLNLLMPNFMKTRQAGIESCMRRNGQEERKPAEGKRLGRPQTM
jgi:hypothetical protein